MAANVLTGLNEVINGGVSLGQLSAALSFSTWTEDLTMSDWSKFYKLVETQDLEGVISHAKQVVDLYKMVWRGLGEPRTREEWRERFYGLDKPKTSQDGTVKFHESKRKLFDLRLADGQTVSWTGWTLPQAVLAYTDAWSGPRVIGWKLHRNKRWNQLP